MFADNHPKAKLTIINNIDEGWYKDSVEVQVELPGGVNYKISAMSKEEYALENFLLNLDIPKEKMEQLCTMIDAYASRKYSEGTDDERYYAEVNDY